MRTLTIGRLAKLGGVNVETVRYYERKGLLTTPPRTPAGYRVFPNDAARRLQFIKRAKQLGFSLNEIRELLSLRRKPGTNQSHIRARAKAKIADIELKIHGLKAMKGALTKLAGRCKGCGPLPDCPILESLDQEVSS
jgi:MerR family transcriptional regulator, copper efflux regulator